MKNPTFIIFILCIVFNSYSQEKGTFTDPREGKTYKTVKIGNQTWMAENLSFKADSSCWCYNDSIKYCEIFGKLYNWKTAKNVCPSRWHLPSNEEWTILINFLGWRHIVGGMLKSTTTWLCPNTGANPFTVADNSSGFTALPGGCTYNIRGEFYGIGVSGNWWSSTECHVVGNPSAFCWYILYNGGYVEKSDYPINHGYSVRC
jgi:uncharacterized protein (TIGR02145 family)